jgi:mannose-6-phosphate isomerase-like protein (cupin superfamily)
MALAPHLPRGGRDFTRTGTPMIPEPTSTKVATHYAWGDGCDGWHLVHAAALSVIEERMPPTSREVRHWHARAMQFFYVIAGTLTIEVEGVTHRLSARTGIQLPQGTAHQAINETDADVEFLVISMPPAQGDRHQEE